MTISKPDCSGAHTMCARDDKVRMGIAIEIESQQEKPPLSKGRIEEDFDPALAQVHLNPISARPVATAREVRTAISIEVCEKRG